MVEYVRDALDRWLGLGLEASELGVGHMLVRTLVVFSFAVILFRMADRRFLGRNAGYDVMLGVVLGSVLSRAINGSAAFFPTLAASAALVGLHHLLSTIAFHSHTWSRLLKGSPRMLVSDGNIDRDELRRNKLTDEDLDESLRLHGQEIGTDDVREARIERNGEISVVTYKKAPTSADSDPSGSSINSRQSA
jgi:uncharacterized membrane protein YcaP (DUF421 family)